MLRFAFSRAAGQSPEPTGVDFFRAILNERLDLNDLFPERADSTFLGAAPKGGWTGLTEPMAYFPGIEGKCSYTIITEGEVFKAPRVDNIPDNEFKAAYIQGRVEEFWIEGRVLRHLRGKVLPVPVPELTCEGEKTVFIGMTRMKGVTFDPAVIDQMTEREKRQLAKDIAGFVAGFEKAISPQDAKLLGFRGDALTAWEMKPEEVQRALDNPDVVKVLGNDVDFCRDMQAAFAERYEEYRHVPQVAGHRDLNFGNMLFDPETNRLSAVIDFGGAGFCRPEWNFLAFSQHCKDDFTSMICEEYLKESGNKITPRDIHVSECVRSVIVLSQTLESGNEKEVQYEKEHISELKKSLAPEPKKNVFLPKALKT